MTDSIALLRRRPLRRLVEGAWIALGGPACVASPTDLADALAYLDLLEGTEAGGDLTRFGELAERVDELFAQPDLEAPPRLQLMTIHKAKGLEFHTVIVPGLGRQARADDPKLLAWAERPNPRARDADLLLAPIRESGCESEPIFDYLTRFDRHEGPLRGRARAVRRRDARDRSAASARPRERAREGCRSRTGAAVLALAAASSLEHRAAAIRERLGPCGGRCGSRGRRRGDATAGAESKGPASMALSRLPLDWRLPAVPAPAAWERADAAAGARGNRGAVEFAWVREVTRHVGTVVHRVLQQIGREGLDGWDKDHVGELRPAIARRLAEAGVPPAQIDAAAARAETALARTLADRRGRWILDRRHADAHVEYALSGVVDGEFLNTILDRTFVDAADVRWIIDYKASAHEGGGLDDFLDRERDRYAAQFERYAALMRMIDARPIRLGLYFPLLGGWREWEYAP